MNIVHQQKGGVKKRKGPEKIFHFIFCCSEAGRNKVCVCVSVCVCERERARERGGVGGEREYVCIWHILSPKAGRKVLYCDHHIGEVTK